MDAITVALLQMTPAGKDQAASLSKGEEYCRRAARMGADIALFPEMWNVGYALPDPDDRAACAAWPERAIGLDAPYIAHFRALARELDMAIAPTFLERWESAPRDSLALIDRRGELRLTYAKVHTCDFDREAALTPGAEFPVCSLETRGGPVQIGAMICFDREFPESARILMLRGAEIILVPNACELEANRLGQLRARAFENMLGAATANYASPRENGHSAAYDGIAFNGDGTSRDTCLLEAGPEEGVYLAAFDLKRLRAYREREVWGNAFRKPRRYGALTGEAVDPPFVRPKARR
jgi:predicted amidohydrolase